MANIEKIIKGLEHCAAGHDCKECPYFSQLYFEQVDVEFKGFKCKCLADAIALLKEKEPMMVRFTTSTIRCPKCNKQMTNRGALHKDIKYCWRCGQAVRWE